MSADGFNTVPQSLYRALPDDHIRVLRLERLCLVNVPSHAGAQDFAIQCSLDVIPLMHSSEQAQNDVILRYTALSYVWGSNSTMFQRFVICDGIVCPITANLFDVLRQLILDESGKELTLWVDAICINQSDDREKSVQVALMGQIYSSAEQVLIWIGTGADTRHPEIENFWKSTSGVLLEDPTEKSKKLAMPFLQAHEWFRRAWTFQEIVLAEKAYIQLGSYRVEWEKLCQYLSEDSMLSAIRQCRANKGSENLLELVHITWNRQATDPRDKIFSLRGVHLAAQDQIEVDYTESIKKICADAILIMSEELRHLVFPALLDLPTLVTERGAGRKFYVREVEDLTHHGTERAIRGYSWIFSWSQRPENFESQIEAAFDRNSRAFRFAYFNHAFRASWRLEGLNLVVAGAMLCAYVADDEAIPPETRPYHGRTGNPSRTIQRYQKPIDAACLSSLTVADLRSWAADPSTFQQGPRASVCRERLISSNEFYEQYLQRHTLQRSCSCYKNKIETYSKILSGKISSLIGKTAIEKSENQAGTVEVDPESGNLAHERENPPRLFHAVLFGTKTTLLLEASWRSDAQRCTFRVVGRGSWNEQLRELDKDIVRARRGHPRTKEYYSPPLSFLSLSFLPMYFELE